MHNVNTPIPDPVTYDIRINEHQRNVIRKCIFHMLQTLPKGMWTSPDEVATAEQLFEYLNPHPTGDTLAMETDTINIFVP